MKFLNIKSILVFALALVLSSCTQDFDEINTNPNYPTADKANPALILPKILFETGNHMTNSMAWGTGNVLAQLVATNNFTGTDRYQLGSFGSTWNAMYINMREAKNLQILGENSNNAGYQGAALVLKSWMIAQLTELYGDVPYSKALDGKNNNFTPAYDTQEEIYKTILTDLKKAFELFSQGGKIEVDIMFNGDLNKWQMFANSLRVRYLMRLEKKWSAMGINGGAEIQEIINSGVYFKSNADNAVVKYNESVNRWPKNTGRVGGFDEKRMSKTIEDVLKGLNDNRMKVLFRPVDNPDSNEFVGVPNGLSEDGASNFNGGAKNQSRLGLRFREEPATVEMVFMNYSELMFIFAEAVQKGYVTGDANTFYENGIKANFQYLELEVADEYLNQTGVKLSGNELSKIATQKWLSLFLVGNEAWYDYRRTGLPALKPGPDAVLNEVPSRAFYPSTEQTLNSANLKAAIDRQGADELTTKMWILK